MSRFVLIGIYQKRQINNQKVYVQTGAIWLESPAKEILLLGIEIRQEIHFIQIQVAPPSKITTT